jgi:hypothetical protein
VFGGTEENTSSARWAFGLRVQVSSTASPKFAGSATIAVTSVIASGVICVGFGSFAASGAGLAIDVAIVSLGSATSTTWTSAGEAIFLFYLHLLFFFFFKIFFSSLSFVWLNFSLAFLFTSQQQ